MKMNKTMTATIAAVVLATGVAVAKTNSAEVVEIVDGGMKWRFVPVVGTSKLPLEFMRTGKNREQTVSVTMPKFWIAEKMVTEGEFAAVIGRKVRANSKAEDVLAGIEWEEALEYCEKFSQKYSAQLPKDVIASIPTMIEWAHAVNIIDERTKNALKNEIVGTFLFTGNANGGFLHTHGSMHTLCESDFSTTFAMISKRAKRWYVGLRMVLVDISGGETFVDKKQDDNTIVSRGALLTKYGLFDQAKRLLGKVGDVKMLSEDQRKRAKEALAFANKEYEYEFEDWSGIISRSAIFAEERGFWSEPFAAIQTNPYLAAVGGWMNAGSYGDEEANSTIDSIIARYYQKAGIVGEWRRIGDLPPDVRKGQSELGKTKFILIEVKKDEEPYKHEYTITESNLVQVLRCDFTGDGREDMVVENYGSVGTDGYRYSFYEAKGDGTYRDVEEVQLVGLCVLPRKDGKGCGFLILCKAGYPALTAHLYVFKNGGLECEDVASKPFYMLDAKTDRIYMKAPFIGERHGIGWILLESCGIWFRPVYWPWKQGEVQGYKDAVKNAQEENEGRKEMIGVGSRLGRFMSKVRFICIALSAVTGCRYAPDGGMESTVPISGGSKANSHEKVQLWKDGPYWATTNIGAEKPWDYGYYFWWGDTVGYKCEDSGWVKTSSFLPFDPVIVPTFAKSPLTLQSEGWIVSRDGVNVLVPEHDAAYVHWGGGWRMPTRQEILDINNKCDWIRTTTNGVIGCVVRGRDDYAANSIFLPCAGYISGTTLYDDGIAGNYWSSVPESDNIFASELYFSKDSDSPDTFDDFRMFGQPVRAVQGFAE